MAVLAALILLAAVQGGSTLLIVAGRRHRRDRALRHHLRAHGVLPRWTYAPVAAVLPPLEIVIGSAGVVAPVVSAAAARAAAAGIAVTYLLFAAYLAVLRRRDPAATCGCLGAADERPGRSLLRAGVLAGAAAACASPGLLLALAAVPGRPLLAVLTAVIGAGAAVLLTQLAAPIRRDIPI
jgi:hypothetical protein